MSSYHPDGLTVDIVGIIASNRGRNCDEHPFWGEIVQESANVSRGFFTKSARRRFRTQDLRFVER